MELTTHLPCAFFSPARIVGQSDESIISAARATAGSLLMYRQKVCMEAALSSSASSIFMSITEAPPSIWWRATAKASS